MTGSVLVLESITPVPCLLFSEYRASGLPLDIKDLKFWKGYSQSDHFHSLHCKQISKTVLMKYYYLFLKVASGSNTVWGSQQIVTDVMQIFTSYFVIILPDVSEFYVHLSTLLVFSPLKVKEFLVLDFIYVLLTTYLTLQYMYCKHTITCILR